MQRPHHRPFAGHGRPARQCGAVAILVALALVLLVGFVGLAIDGGHLYLTKTELQNSADACALAASNELTTLTSANYSKAVAAGQTVAYRNKVNFQGSAIVAGNVSVSFGGDLKAGTSWITTATAAGSTTPRPAYVRCTVTRPGIAMFFMSVLGFGSQTAASLATAALVPSQGTCVASVGLCTVGSTTAPFGLSAGNWYTGPAWTLIGFNGNIKETDVVTSLELNGTCSVKIGQTVGLVTVNGSGLPIAKAWNTHFGLYQGYTVPTPPPDFTGYSYTAKNWPSSNNALSDFISKRSSFTPYGSNGDTTTGLSMGGGFKPAAQSDYQTYGANRRMIVTPIIDCSKNSGAMPILEFGCVLMLQPFSKTSDAPINLEYEGLASASGSPCGGAAGIPGSSTSSGVMVPALVQ